MDPTEPVTIEGELVRFGFRSDDGAFAVARVKIARESGDPPPQQRQARIGGFIVRPGATPLTTVVGPVGHVSEGQFVRLTGQWTSHPEFGRQLRVDRVMVAEPRTLDGLRAYLSSDAVPGLGPTMARRIVDRFGLDTLRVIEREPQRLSEVQGIGPKRIGRLVEQWEKTAAFREVHVALRGHGVGQAIASRIVERYAGAALSVVTREPWRLADEVRGVGFRTADAIARAQGISADDPARARAALTHVLREAADTGGHCFLPQQLLLDRAAALGIRDGSPALEAHLKAGTLRAPPAPPGLSRPIYLPTLDGAEGFVARRLTALGACATVAIPLPDGPIGGLELSPGQRRAVSRALSDPVTIITGGPGTGKTTVVRALVAMAAQMGETWLLAAPTGRAARRLADVTGVEARTLHRLLEFNPADGRFRRGDTARLQAHGVLVDEASMIDLRLMAALVAAVPEGCRLVLVGDADQLPSVGAGRVLGDLIDSGTVPVATLSEVYRQAAGSAIVASAWHIRDGAVPQSGGDFFVIDRSEPDDIHRTLLEVVGNRLPRLGFDPRRDVQVLTPMHGGLLGTEALNRSLQALINPTGPTFSHSDRLLRQGDRVIQVRNDYDVDVFNGDLGRVRAVGEAGVGVDWGGRLVQVTDRKLRDLQLAYAISIHKSQGSEYPAVVVVLSRAHRIMLRRRLLYTAVTRARRFCVLIGDPWAVRTAVESRGEDNRWTRLAERLMG